MSKVVTGKVRISFPHLFEPFAFNEGDKAKYSATILIPKSDKDTLEKIRKAEKNAIEKGRSAKWGGKLPAKLQSPLRDGDEEGDDYPERAGHFFLTVRSSTKPGVVDRQLNPILDTSEIYSGVYGRVSITAFAYDAMGNKGVSFALGNVQKLADGESLGGGSKPSEDFEAIDDDDLL